MIYERMNINMRFDLFGILHTRAAPYKTKYCAFAAEVFFSGAGAAGGGGCREEKWAGG